MQDPEDRSEVVREKARGWGRANELGWTRRGARVARQKRVM